MKYKLAGLAQRWNIWNHRYLCDWLNSSHWITICRIHHNNNDTHTHTRTHAHVSFNYQSLSDPESDSSKSSLSKFVGMDKWVVVEGLDPTFGEATRPLAAGMGALSKSESESESLELESLPLSLDDSESTPIIPASFGAKCKKRDQYSPWSTYQVHVKLPLERVPLAWNPYHRWGACYRQGLRSLRCFHSWLSGTWGRASLSSNCGTSKKLAHIQRLSVRKCFTLMWAARRVVTVRWVM